jgi:hypothetical protein
LMALLLARGTLQLKADFKARGIFVDYLSIRGDTRNTAILGCSPAAINHFEVA